MAVTIIVKGSRKRMVRQQKAVIDYVDKQVRSGKDVLDPKIKEAVSDFSRWNNESGVYKNRDKDTKGREYCGTDSIDVDLTK
jgi:hypothetical protein